MPEGFTPAPEDVEALRKRLKARDEQAADFADQRNAVLETENPDDAAYDSRKARELGIPREAIGGAREEYRQEDTLAKMQRLREQSPRTSAWLQQPENYSIARDEIDELGGIEGILQSMDVYSKGGAGEQLKLAPSSIMNAIALKGMAIADNPRAALLNAPNPVPFVDLGVAADAALDGRVKVRGADEIADVAKRAGNAFRNPFARAKIKVPEAVTKTVDKTGEAVSDPVNQWLEEAVSAFQLAHEARRPEVLARWQEINAKRPVFTNTGANRLSMAERSIAELLPLFIAGAVTRDSKIPLEGMEAMVTGDSYGRYVAEGKLTPDQAIVLSRIQGQAERFGEKIVLDTLFSPREMAKKYAQRFVLSMAGEQVQEQATTLIQSFSEWQIANPEKTAEQWAEEYKRQVADTAVVTALVSGPMNATVLGAEKVVTDLAERRITSETSPDDKRIDDLLNRVGRIKLTGRSPEKAAELLDRVTEGSNLETLTVDLDGVADALQQAGVDPAETLEALGVPADQLAQRFERFGEIEIKTSTLLVSPLMREYRQAIQPHLRSSQDQLTPAQKEAAQAGLQADVTRMAAVIKEQLDTGVELEAKQQKVVEAVRERIRGAAVFAERTQENATVATQAAMVNTLAARLGVDPMEFYEQHFPRVQTSTDGMIAEEDALEQPQSVADLSARINEAWTPKEGASPRDIASSRKQAVEDYRSFVRTATAEELKAAGDLHYGRELIMKLEAPQLAKMMKTLGLPTPDKAMALTDMRAAIEAAINASPRSDQRADDSLNQLIGPRAKSADKAILNVAKKMAKERVKTGKGLFAKSKPKYTRQQIWDETAKLGQPWYQDKNGDWISEIEDGSIVVKNASGKMDEVIEMPSIYSQYPQLGKMRADARDKARVKRETGKEEPGGVGGWYQKSPFLFGAHVRIISRGERAPYTATHEIQHAVDDIEGREMGLKKPYYMKDTERRAFNTMYRRLWTMEERIATPPWKTEEEAVRWWGGLRSMDAPEAQFDKDGTLDPGVKIELPASTERDTPAEMGNVPDEARNTDLVMPGEPVRTTYFDEQRQRERLSIERGADVLESKLAGRTFLSFKDIATSMINNARIRQLVDSEAVPQLTEAEMPAFEKALGAEIDLVVGAAKQAEKDFFEKKGEFFRAMVGTLLDFEADTILKYIDKLDLPLIRAATDIEGIARIIAGNQFDGTSRGRFGGIEARIDTRVMGSDRLEDAIRVFRGEAVEPKKVRRGTNTATAAETKRVRDALEGRLLDLDKTIDEQTPEVAAQLRAMIATEQARDDLRRYGYDQVLPGYFDGMTVNQILRELAASRMDENAANYERGKRNYGMQKVVETLRDAGIVGAKYVPGGVRGAAGGKDDFGVELNVLASKDITRPDARTRTFGSIVLEKGRNVFRDGKQLGFLTGKEHELVALFMANPNSIMMPSAIVNILYPEGPVPDEKIVAVFVAKLRKKMGPNFPIKWTQDGYALTNFDVAEPGSAPPTQTEQTEDAPPQTQSIVIFDERAPVLLTDQSGNLMQEKRGQYSPSQNVITMFEARDITTMMHEGAHWYLDMLEKMAAAEDPHQFVTEQLAAIEGWYAGLVKAGKRPALEGADRWRDRQETFAETFEVYLQTGKAPSSALRDAFRAFKSWITALWRNIRTGRIEMPERANLNPDIVAVMDRMLAVDEEIDAQAAGISVQANEMAKALLDKGIITQAQFDKAAANLDEAREKTKEEYLVRILDDLRREKEAEWRTEERRTKGDVTREFDVSPVGRLISWLGYGQWKGDVPVGEAAGQAEEEVEFFQSIRTAARMPMAEVDAWVRANITASESDFPNGDILTVVRFPLTEDDGAPEVMLSIRMKADGKQSGRADVNLFLDNQMADALDTVEDVAQRGRMAMEMFGKAVLVLRQYAAEYDPRAFSFVAAESQAEGTKAKSREDLYRYMLSSMKMDGYTAYEVESQTSVINVDADGAKTANPMFPSAGFMLVKDGENVEDFARNEILRGNQRGGGAGEVVTALTAKRLTPDLDASGRRLDRRGSRTGAADTGGAVDDTLGQSGLAPERTLFVAHNTSEEKLRKTLELGGFPMPSLAVARTDKGGFPGYGEITFLADPKLLDEPDVTAYDADIYSPRVPEQYPKVSPEKAGAFVKKSKALIPEGAMIPDYLGYDETDRDLPRTLMSSELVQLAYLSEQGKAPKLKKLKVAKEVKAALKTEYESPERAALALAYYTRLDQELNAARAEKGIEPTNIYIEDDGSVSYRNQRNFDDLISEAKRSPYDQKAYKSELYNRTMGSLAAREKFAKYTAELAGEITESYRIFKGFTYSGNRKWAPFNLENVMAEMRKDLREGNHDAFGGTGSIRARVGSTAMPKMKDVQRNRDRIVSDEEMQTIKDRQAERFIQLADEIAKHYKFAATGIRYYDAAAEAIAGGPKEWRESFGAEALPAIRAYVEELKALPTEYFEAKANRVMRIEDFAAAVVPRNVSPDILQALRATGVDVRFYKRGDEADRLRAVQQMEGLLFQPGDPKGWGETAPPPDLPPMRLDLEAVRRDYGEEAVRKLPRPVHDRSRDRNSIDGMMDTIRATEKTLKRKPPKSLFEFIRSRKARTVAGKTIPIKQWGIKGAADELKAMDRADLVNEENGIPIDDLRVLVEEAGYIGQEGDAYFDSTINDLLAAIDKEARGEKVYSRFDRQEVSDYENAEQWRDWLDSNGIDVFETDQKKLRAQVAALVTSTSSDAVHPDQAAEAFGFGTGEEMLNAMAAIGSREKFIAAETKRRMDAEFGNPFTDGTFAEEARIAAESEMKARAAEIEMEALARAVGEVAASKMAKDMAMDSLSLMTVKELGRWERFLDAERREMKTSLEALRKGDPVKAFIHKRRQLVNMHLARAAREKMEAVEKTRRDLMSYYTSKGRRDKIAGDYLEKIEAILDGYELRVSKQAPGVQKERLSAKAYVAQMIADGRESEVAPEAMLLAELADAKVWRNLTIDEVEYLAGTVRNLAHLGRTKGRLMREQEKRRFEAIVAELETTLDAAPSSRDDRAQSFTRTTGEKVATWLRKAHARLTRLEFEFTRLDGKENGALVNQLWKPFAEAGDVETERMRGAAEAMNDLYAIFSNDERNALFHRRVATPELKVPGKGLTLMDVVVIGLNWGNEGNRQALLDGYGWDGAAVEAVLNRVLTDKHWQFIEGVWGLVGSYRADAFALHKAITGVEPKAVEGITFTLANGRVVKGQYYPLKYDSAQPRADSVRQSRLDEKQALSEMGKSFSKPMTKTGHLIERVGSGGKPVMLSIGVFHEHVANVIHDIAYRRAIIDANKIITNPKFANAYIRAAGREQYDQLLPWLAQIANERKQEPGGYVTDIMRGARKNFSIMAMGLKIGTAVQQTTGILQGIPLIGTRYAAQGFVKAFAGGPGMFWSSWNWVSQKSEFMRDRPMGFDRDVREVTNKLQERTPLGPIQRNAFILIGLMDTAVSTSVWIGAYDKAMDGNTDGITKGDEDAAIAYADSVVRRSQVAGRMQDLPAMMRGTELEKLMTVVYSYFSGLYNETASEVMRVRGGQLHPLAFTGNMAILYIIVPLLASTLAGRLFDDDDDDELPAKIGKEIASNAVSTIPFVRDVINATINPQFGYQLSPAGSIIEGGTKAASNLATGEGFSTEYATKQSLNLLGLLFGLPTGQMFITGDYIYDVAVGNEDPAADPADAASEALLRSTR